MQPRPMAETSRLRVPSLRVCMLLLLRVRCGAERAGTGRPCHYIGQLAVVEPACGLLGVVSQRNGGAGALDAGQDFEGDALLIEPAFRGSGFYHGVFAAYVVGAYGDVELFADGADYVE